MKDKVNIYIVVPAYNEENSISGVIGDLRKHNFNNIIVVDDGSTDDTNIVAKKDGAVVIKHPINLGQGTAVKTGIDYALLLGAEIIVTFDADGQHLAKDLDNLVKPLINNEVEVALGSRFLDNNSNVPWLKKIFLKGGTLLLFLMYGIMLTDTHNGFRALSRSAAEKIHIRSRGMEHASEILEEIKIKKIRYKEIPVTIKYSTYSISKGQRISNSLNIFFKMLSKWFMN